MKITFQGQQLFHWRNRFDIRQECRAEARQRLDNQEYLDREATDEELEQQDRNIDKFDRLWAMLNKLKGK